jgi:hypothetical protein
VVTTLCPKETATLSSLQKQLQELAVYKPSGDAPESSNERSSTAPADLKLSMFDKLFGTETAEQKQLKARLPCREFCGWHYSLRQAGVSLRAGAVPI